MKSSEITIGSTYLARVSGKFVHVKVLEIREEFRGEKSRRVYFVVNLATNRRLVFRSAQKFRREIKREVVS